jgi:protein TonB
MAMLTPAPRLQLPRTRSFTRTRPMRVWWLAVTIAVVANLAMVVALSQLSRLHAPSPPPPLVVRTLRQIAPETPPPPPEQPKEAPQEKPEEVVPLALPSLDLPPVSTSSTLSLPALGTLDPSMALPLSIPAFAAIGPPSSTPATAQLGAAIAPPGFDTPPHVDTDFDLDRYYPRTARLRGVTGQSRLRIASDANGQVVTVTVLESSPPGIFDTAAERLGHALHFHPAQAQGRSVASVQDITIDWTIK